MAVQEEPISRSRTIGEARARLAVTLAESRVALAEFKERMAQREPAPRPLLTLIQGGGEGGNPEPPEPPADEPLHVYIERLHAQSEKQMRRALGLPHGDEPLHAC